MVVKREVIEANKTTLWSAWRSLFKKDLTGPTLLEMFGDATNSLLKNPVFLILGSEIQVIAAL